MTKTYETITLQEARQMLEAAEVAAERIGLAYNVAVVDSGGHLVAFIRQDGALIGSIDLAIRKARTARIFDKTTEHLSELAQPGAPLYGIDHTNSGSVVILGGGLPIVIGNHIVGAVGTSAGTVEQDIAVAQAAIDALNIKN